MNPKRHSLDRILGWVGYGCAYSVDEEEAQAHRARQPDDEAATERRSVAVWAAADDTWGLSDEQLRTRLGGVLAKTHGLRSATRNILKTAADRLPSAVEGMQARAIVEEIRERVGAVRGRVADRFEPVARLPKQVGVVGPAHGVDSTAGGHGETQAAALLGPVVVPSDEQHETGSRLSSDAADAHTDGHSQDVEELQAAAESRLADELAKARAEAEERQHQDLVPRSEKHLVFFPAFDELGVAMPVAPRDVRQDRPAAVRMIRIVGVGQREIATPEKIASIRFSHEA